MRRLIQLKWPAPCTRLPLLQRSFQINCVLWKAVLCPPHKPCVIKEMLFYKESKTSSSELVSCLCCQIVDSQSLKSPSPVNDRCPGSPDKGESFGTSMLSVLNIA